MEEILVHPLNLGGQDVTHPVVKFLQMIPLAAELEGGHQPILRQNLDILQNRRSRRREPGHRFEEGVGEADNRAGGNERHASEE